MDETEALMKSLWQSYKDTKDIGLLMQACNRAPFFGNPDMGREIAALLAELQEFRIGAKVSSTKE
tara:strand:+ start:63 stop:257 length:195 start_codon:yes stop_codon:yes gene_type:complete